MSTVDELRKWIKAKALFVLPPETAGAPSIRTMIVSAEVYFEVQPANWPDNWDGHRLAQFRGTLDAFTEGLRISVGEDPYKKRNTAFMARTSPVSDHIFDIRSLDPRPGIRCLGGFFERDKFLALTWNYHEALNGGAQWSAEITRCKAEWTKLFGEPQPQLGDNIDACLSNYYVV